MVEPRNTGGTGQETGNVFMGVGNRQQVPVPDQQPEKPEIVVPQIARAAHQANKVYCESLGDKSQVPWENAPEWQLESTIDGVQYRLANPGAPVSAQHIAWLKEKEEAGWKYGPEKDPEKKEHPCMMPFAELPDKQQFKDHLFVGIVRLYAAHFTIV